MLQLVLMRHAKSDWSDESLDDHDRTLNPRGRRDAPAMGNWLSGEGLVPDLVLASTAKRASETAEMLQSQWSGCVPIRYIKRLYHSTPETIMEIVTREAGEAQRVLVVAHNPGMEVLAGHFSGACGQFPTAAIMALEFSVDSWSEVSLGSRPVVTAQAIPRMLRGDD